MNRPPRYGIAHSLLILAALVAGCASPYHADRGALLGGLGGAGVGALVGHAVGNTGAGAAIGAGVGALTGAAIGDSMDEMEARNRALIEAKLQRRIVPGAVTIDDVIAMTRAGVAEDVIINHVRYHGMVRQLEASDLITLQQQGISPNVVKAMQEPPRPQRETVFVESPSPPAVIVRERYYDPWYDPWSRPGPPYYYRYYGHRPPPRVGVGVSFHN